MNGKTLEHIRTKFNELDVLLSDLTVKHGELAELITQLELAETKEEPTGETLADRTVVDLTGSLATNPNSEWYPYRKRDLNGLTHHVIHHTAVNRDSTPQAIANYHAFTKNWPGAAYTFYITYDGTIYRLNSTDTASFATYNMNHRYLSTCLAGAFTEGREPTQAQIEAARWLHHVYIPHELNRSLPLIGHKEGDHQNSTCPGTTFDIWRKHIEKPY